MTTQVYISDTNIWIDFRNADVLDELFRLPFRLCCTDFVLGELKDLPIQDLVAQGLIVETLEGSAIGELYELCAAPTTVRWLMSRATTLRYALVAPC